MLYAGSVTTIRPTRSRGASALLALSLSCLPAAARADAPPGSAPAALSVDEREGRARFASGSAAFEAGRYADAHEDFARAHRLTHNPVLLYNVGLAADRMGDHARAAVDAYRAYLEARPQAENREEVRQRIAELEAQLTPPAPPPVPVPASTPLVLPQAYATGPQPHPVLVASERRTPAARHRLTASQWALFGGGGTATILGVVLLGVGLHDRAQVADPNGAAWPSIADQYERSPRRIGIGGALSALGVAGLVTGALLHRRATVVVSSAPRGGSVAVRGAF
jgi:tetratricopeptide (TPR) repeat protein